jgi:predicted Fe-S protein YdhL (DUF1289 family)
MDIKSPCISLCQVNEEGVCIGCKRTLEEISEWSIMSNYEKKCILEGIKFREMTGCNSPESNI